MLFAEEYTLGISLSCIQCTRSVIGRDSFDTHYRDSLQTSTMLGNCKCHWMKMKPGSLRMKSRLVKE